MFISSNAISNTKHEQSQAPWIFETPRSGLFPKLLWSQIDSHQYSVRIPPSLIVCFRSGLLWQYSGARPSLGWTTRTTSASSPSSVSSPGSISSVWLLSSRWGRSLFSYKHVLSHTPISFYTHSTIQFRHNTLLEERIALETGVEVTLPCGSAPPLPPPSYDEVARTDLKLPLEVRASQHSIKILTSSWPGRASRVRSSGGDANAKRGREGEERRRQESGGSAEKEPHQSSRLKRTFLRLQMERTNSGRCLWSSKIVTSASLSVPDALSTNSFGAESNLCGREVNFLLLSTSWVSG